MLLFHAMRFRQMGVLIRPSPKQTTTAGDYFGQLQLDWLRHCGTIIGALVVVVVVAVAAGGRLTFVLDQSVSARAKAIYGGHAHWWPVPG